MHFAVHTKAIQEILAFCTILLDRLGEVVQNKQYVFRKGYKILRYIGIVYLSAVCYNFLSIIERNDCMTTDMTSGKPLKLIIAFCIPMMLGNLLQQLYNIVDAAVVGQYLGDNAVGAVGVTGSICFLIIGFATGICSGFSMLVAQSYGAGDYSKMRRYVINALYLCGAVSIVLTTVTLLCTRKILELINTPDELIDQSYEFLFITFAGLTVTILYNILSCVMRALGDSRSPLIFLGISTVLNIFLDITFIKIMGSVGGAAIATVISQFIASMLCLIYIRRKFEILMPDKSELAFDPKLSLELISIGIPMALQFSITAIGTIIIQNEINKLGTYYVVAVTAASKIQNIVTGPMECLGVTLATYCGQNKGARKYDRIIKGLKQGILIAIAYCVCAWMIVNLFGRYIALLFIEKESVDVIDLAMSYLRITTSFFPVLGILFLFRNSLQGLGYSMLPMTAGITELAARIFVARVLVAAIGFTGVCLAGPAAWFAADVLLIITAIVKLPRLKKELA